MCGIYLDYQSAMPIDPRVMEFSERYLTREFGNPSALHSVGLTAKSAIEDARVKVAELINAEDPSNIIFTGSATEANNLAIKGTALRNSAKGKKILASAIEHISVLNAMKDLQKGGLQLTLAPVDSKGIVDLVALEKLLSKDTILTSVMYANSEIGTIEPIKEISQLVHDRGTFLHIDAVAAQGRIPIDVQKEGIDLLTISSNDMYGPRGAGAPFMSTQR